MIFAGIACLNVHASVPNSNKEKRIDYIEMKYKQLRIDIEVDKNLLPQCQSFKLIIDEISKKISNTVNNQQELQDVLQEFSDCSEEISQRINVLAFLQILQSSNTDTLKLIEKGFDKKIIPVFFEILVESQIALLSNKVAVVNQDPLLQQLAQKRQDIEKKIKDYLGDGSKNNGGE